LRLRGLITIPDPASTRQQQRDAFAPLRKLLSELQAADLELNTLSMGMSADSEDAMAEGATIGLSGSDIFGPWH